MGWAFWSLWAAHNWGVFSSCRPLRGQNLQPEPDPKFCSGQKNWPIPGPCIFLGRFGSLGQVGSGSSSRAAHDQVYIGLMSRLEIRYKMGKCYCTTGRAGVLAHDPSQARPRPFSASQPNIPRIEPACIFSPCVYVRSCMLMLSLS